MGEVDHAAARMEGLEHVIDEELTSEGSGRASGHCAGLPQSTVSGIRIRDGTLSRRSVQRRMERSVGHLLRKAACVSLQN